MEEVGQVPHHKLFIYYTKYSFLIAGYSRQRKRYALLRIARQDGPYLQAKEDAQTYTLSELNTLLQSTHAQCAQQGGLQFVCKAYGLVGCIRFTASYYLLIITRRSYVGSICGHKVFAVSSVSLLPLGAAVGMSQQKDSAVERRYRSILMGVDLSKNFYFSLTYRLASTLQANHRMGLSPTQGQPSPFASGPFSNDEFDSMFCWNSYLTRQLRLVLGNCLWLVALVHGFWDQRRVSVLGRPMTITLIARRSRHFAGTRYKKRGLSDQGKVANEVEVEQILDVGVDPCSGLPLISSMVQVRGSVPLYWSQQPTPLSPKPDILLQSFDPMYESTALHFDDLRARYGAPIVCLNLLKSNERRPRETLLRREMGVAIAMLNKRSPDGPQLVHVPWDLQKHAKTAGAGLLTEIASITHLTLEATGLFVHHPSTVQMAPNLPVPTPAALGLPVMMPQNSTASSHSHSSHADSSLPQTQQPQPKADTHQQSSLRTAAKKLYRSHLYSYQPPSDDDDMFVPPWYTLYQQGVLRTNCIDCLDRTNVAQFAYGLVAFGLQLYLLGVADSPEIDSDSTIALILMEQYEVMGNTLSMQYGGSDAHSMFFQRKKGQWEAGSRSKDLLTSIQRFYSNTYTDAEKQDAINLVLGNYIPGRPGQPELWELEHDVYLHNVSDHLLSQSIPPSPVPSRPPSLAPIRASPAQSFMLQSVASSGPGSPSTRTETPLTHRGASTAASVSNLALPSTPAGSAPSLSPFVTQGQRGSLGTSSRAVSVLDNISAASRGGGGGGTITPHSLSLTPQGTSVLADWTQPLQSPITTSVSLLSLSSDDDGLGVDVTLAVSPNNDFDGLLAALGHSADPSQSGEGGAAGGSGGSGESTWGTFGGLWSSLFGSSSNRSQPSHSGGGNIPLPKEARAFTLQSFDLVLGKPCRRSLPVRLHTVKGGQDQPVWQAVQQAFSYFWSQADEDNPTPVPPAIAAAATAQQQPSRPPLPAPSAPKTPSKLTSKAQTNPSTPQSATADKSVTGKGGDKSGSRGNRVPSQDTAPPPYLCATLLGTTPSSGDTLRSRLTTGRPSRSHQAVASPFLVAVLRVRDGGKVLANGVLTLQSRANTPLQSFSSQGGIPSRRGTGTSVASFRVTLPSTPLQVPPCAACVWSLSDSRRSAMAALMKLGRKLGHGLTLTASSSGPLVSDRDARG